jgi:hypothetical protein
MGMNKRLREGAKEALQKKSLRRRKARLKTIL